MSEKLDSRGTAIIRWLMIYSRPLIVSLLAVNLLVAGGLSLRAPDTPLNPPVDQVPSSTQELERDLVLLSESPMPEKEDKTNVLVKECRVWGPQQDKTAFNDLNDTLQATGGFPELVELEIEAPPSYMVFVDVREGSVQARQVMQELDAILIDNYRISRDDGDIISVGVFSNPDLAENQLQKVRDLGYNTELEAIERNQTVFTLHGYVESGSELFASSSHECGNDKSLEVSQY